MLVLTAPLSSPTGFAQGALAAYVAGSQVMLCCCPVLLCAASLAAPSLAQVIIPSKEFDKDASLKAIDEYFASAIVGAPGQTVTPTGKQLKSL